MINWKSINEIPPYDMDYLCIIIRNNPCGTVLKYQQVIKCDHAKFNVKENEIVTHWSELPKYP